MVSELNSSQSYCYPSQFEFIKRLYESSEMNRMLVVTAQAAVSETAVSPDDRRKSSGGRISRRMEKYYLLSGE